MNRRKFILSSAALATQARAQMLTPIFAGQPSGQPAINISTNSGAAKVHPFPTAGQGALIVTKSGSALTINWGDGNSDSNPSPGHTYASNGIKTIRISTPDNWLGVTEFDIQKPNGAASPYTNGTVGTPDLIVNMPNISMLTNLQHFEMCDCWFSGDVQDFSLFSALQYLDLQGNFLTGSLLLSSTQLTTVDVHVNAMSGQLPPILSSNANLSYLVGYDNSFSGTIPSLAAATGLTSFDFSVNNLTGVTAGCFSTQKSLSILNLQNNLLTAGAVNQVLADCVASLGGGRIACTVTLNGTNAAPTGQGLTDKATLQGAGWTVTTN